jgi:glycosyltransferase involved in cell wall biosynthesis
MNKIKPSNQLTIVIPNKNEKQGIIDVLNLLLKQTHKYKIIIADSSNDADSLSLLKKYQSKNSDQIEITNGGLPSLARNNGAIRVLTPYILFLDADIYLKDKYIIDKCLNIAIDNNYDLVTCKFRSLDGKYKWVWKIFDIAQWISSKTKPFAVGGFMLFKTDTFKKLNGFNEEDKIAEDYRLSSKINPKKFKITNLYVHTPSRRFEKKGLWYMIKLLILCWWNRNNNQFFKQDYNYWK